MRLGLPIMIQVKPMLLPSFIEEFQKKSKDRSTTMIMQCDKSDEISLSTSSSDGDFYEENFRNRKCSRMCSIS